MADIGMKSKKPLDASSKQPRKRKRRKKPSPKEPIFFLDENLSGKTIVGGLRAVGVKVEAHGDHFSPGTADTIWLKAVGKKGWLVLTKDKNIRYREVERVAVVHNKVRMFVLTAKDLKATEIAEILVKAVAGMKRVANRNKGPFIAGIAFSGAVKIRDEFAKSKKVGRRSR